MSAPIQITKDWLKIAQTQFCKSAGAVTLVDGKLQFSQELKYDNDESVSIVFAPEAFAKMLVLIQDFDTEVAWHGVVKRDILDDKVFRVKDIVVYPQVASVGYVNMNPEEYASWLGSHIYDDDFDHLHMQGHSHVWAAPNPSHTDIQHQADIVSGLPSDAFYIFMIWNKKSEYTVKVFDMKANRMYSGNEVLLKVGEKGFDYSSFLAEAHSNVKNHERIPEHYYRKVVGEDGSL